MLHRWLCRHITSCYITTATQQLHTTYTNRNRNAAIWYDGVVFNGSIILAYMEQQEQ